MKTRSNTVTSDPGSLQRRRVLKPVRPIKRSVLTLMQVSHRAAGKLCWYSQVIIKHIWVSEPGHLSDDEATSEEEEERLVSTRVAPGADPKTSRVLELQEQAQVGGQEDPHLEE